MVSRNKIIRIHFIWFTAMKKSASKKEIVHSPIISSVDFIVSY